MRDMISNFLVERALENKDFYVLSGDHGYALFDKIRKEAGDQFINTGVTEQAMIGAAAGMAKTGKKVVAYGLACFIPMRVLEFIKMSICYEKLPVIILGDGAGMIYTTLGSSHQCAEDIACLKTLPIKIFSPADKFEMKLSLEEAYSTDFPCYIRVGKCDKPTVHNNGPLTKLKTNIPIHSSTNTTAIFATGSMVSTGLEIAKKYDLSLFSCPILSHFDRSEFVSNISKFKNVISIEEHSIHGGLGSIVSDLIAEEGLNARLMKFGVKDHFTKGVGSYEYAMKFHKLDSESITEAIKNAGIV
tara:strand:- start:11371 stop:12276 length:906 start_codon:yes stop_codon:yes gene_type:complete